MNTLAVQTPYTVPTAMMEALQITLLVLVAVGATAVVLIRAGVRQVLMLSIYGVLLAVLFLAFQAPDVTLSELVVGAVVLPVILLLTLAKVSSKMMGSATAPTTSSDSVTSGAWKARNSTASSTP